MLIEQQLAIDTYNFYKSANVLSALFIGDTVHTIILDFTVEEKHVPGLITLEHFNWSAICGQCGLLPSETSRI